MSAVRDALSSIRRLGRSRPFTPDMRPLAMSKDEEAAFLANPQSDLETVFAKHQGRTVHKWVHYLPVYERAFAAYRGKKNLVLLEIGVSLGGSLEVWREYFGDNATIAGIDLDERCRQRFDPPNRVFIGSQADPDFLRKTVEEIGTPDIVIDDGSHVASHQRISFETLFPLLASDGVYIIEDTHTAYWKTTFEGGYRRPENIIEYCKAI
ncbi:MAG: hypothetical protein JWN21_2553, partial [Sphingomonas bacterium]|uniref:class I SAM-dependent methyltransferase n=1 Tax=Sphingomonas bacterium TaxID=1895847 RepID=UPI002A65868F|nr:hypothetical protein [Sphingomonas bacterium]